MKSEQIQEVANLLQHKILANEIATDHYLRQNELEQLLNVNRFTVRQVLAELTGRGVLEHIPYKGHRVRVHSVTERDQITRTRLLLEQGAAELVMINIDEQGLAQLEQYAKAFDAAIECQDTDQQIKSNYLFHSVFYSYCQNPFMSDLIAELREKGIRVSRPGWFNLEASRQASKEHFQMIEALREQDMLGLKSHIYQHLNAWKRYSKQPQNNENQT